MSVPGLMVVWELAICLLPLVGFLLVALESKIVHFHGSRWFPLAFLASAVSAVLYPAGGISTLIGHGQLSLTLGFGALEKFFLVVVEIVAAVIVSFAARHLRYDPDRLRFFGGTAFVALSIALLTLGASLLTVAAGWIALGYGYAWTLNYRRGRQGRGREEARRLVRYFAISDVLFVAGAGLLGRFHPGFEVGRLAMEAGMATHLGTISWVGMGMIAVSILVKSAQGPFFGWLPGTVNAPTPASALLHAGVINGGLILLVRLSPFVLANPPFAIAIGAVGAVTAVVVSTLGRFRADYKGKLVCSTAAQMGFVVIEVALGQVLLAVIHITLHALYKATLFLGSSSQVSSLRGRVLRGVGEIRLLDKLVVLAGLALAAAILLAPLGTSAGLDPVSLFGLAAVVVIGSKLLSQIGKRDRLAGTLALLAISAVLTGFGALVLYLVPAIPIAQVDGYGLALLALVAMGGWLLPRYCLRGWPLQAFDAIALWGRGARVPGRSLGALLTDVPDEHLPLAG